MPEVARTNVDIGGGVINSGSGDVIVNGNPCARKTDTVNPHDTVPSHTSGPPIVSGSGSVIVNGLECARKGDPVDCGHSIASGSPNVFAGDTAGGSIEEPAAVPQDVLEEGTSLVQGRIVYSNTPAGIGAAVRSERAVSPALATFHEDTATPDQVVPPPDAVPPEGCVNSKYYILADSKMAIEAQVGLTAEQIQCNWIALCTNILDPIRDAGFKFKINSAFRTLAYNRSIGSSDTSDHTTGCAADISVGGNAENVKLFNAILNKLPYSQVIYEGHWVHVAYKGRGPKGPAKVMYTYTGANPQKGGANGENLPADLLA